jgi:hypothetical protein
MGGLELKAVSNDGPAEVEAAAEVEEVVRVLPRPARVVVRWVIGVLGRRREKRLVLLVRVADDVEALIEARERVVRELGVRTDPMVELQAVSSRSARKGLPHPPTRLARVTPSLETAHDEPLDGHLHTAL